MRLDVYLKENFNLRSRTYAENLIKTGRVFVNGEAILRTSYEPSAQDVILISEDENYASQGAYKLEEAFNAFGLDVRGKRCLDLGCSNGGFTDCLLRHGAGSVLAVDIGECALPEELKHSGKVEFLRANARELPSFVRDMQFACSDLSFISLKLVLGEIYRALAEEGEAVLLVKPQFELNRRALNKQGVVKDEKLRLSALDGVIEEGKRVGFELLGKCTSPVRYAQKNVEYLIWLKKPAR